MLNSGSAGVSFPVISSVISWPAAAALASGEYSAP
jgi:hypothetical protein